MRYLGGQYTNLKAQARSLGLGRRWEEIKKIYSDVNELFGDIIKVTPSSKVVGDLVLFLVQNNLTTEDVITQAQQLSFPESAVMMMRGDLGQPPGGFPKEVQSAILKGEKAITERPGSLIPFVDFKNVRDDLEKKLGHSLSDSDVLSHLLYPAVFQNFHKHRISYGDTSVIPTSAFYYGMEPGDEIIVEIEEGKTILIKLFAIGQTEKDGRVPLLFELNGQSRAVRVYDKSLQIAPDKIITKADATKDTEIGAPLSGKIVKFFVNVGDTVKSEQPLFVVEAMKMQTNVKALVNGCVKKIYFSKGDSIDAGDLVIELEDQT